MRIHEVAIFYILNNGKEEERQGPGGAQIYSFFLGRASSVGAMNLRIRVIAAVVDRTMVGREACDHVTFFFFFFSFRDSCVSV